jgi:hypothetical protein
MTKEIIIDGIDVSKCEAFFKANKTCYNCYACEGSNCYFKQLKRLEQENKELEKQLLEDKILDEHIESLSQEDTYRSALEEIRVIAKFNQFYNPEDLLINGDIGQIQNLKMTEIYNKINEVLNV